MNTAPIIILRTLYDYCLENNFKHPHMIIAKELINGRYLTGKAFTVRDIKLEVYKYLGFTEQQADSKKRYRELVEARHIAMSLCAEFKQPNWTFSFIGEEIGNKDHSTVMHAVRVIRDYCDTEPKFKLKYEDIRELIIQKFNLKNGKEKK